MLYVWGQFSRPSGGESRSRSIGTPGGGGIRTPPAAPKSDEEKLAEALDLVTGTIEALAAERGGDEKIWGSMVKQALKRVRPGFNESYYGFRSFNALLEEAQARGLVRLERDEKSGGYAVRMGAE